MTSSKRNKIAHPLNASTPVISSRVLHKANLDQQAIAAAKAKDLADYQQANSAHASDHTPSVLATVKQPRLNTDTPPSHECQSRMDWLCHAPCLWRQAAFFGSCIVVQEAFSQSQSPAVGANSIEFGENGAAAACPAGDDWRLQPQQFFV